MKTLIFAILLIASVINFYSCGSAGPEFNSVKDYQNGEWTPGWWYDGMSAEEVKQYLDGMTDSRAKNLAVKFFEEKYILKQAKYSTSDEIVFGTVAITNELNKRVLVGASLIGGDSTSSVHNPKWYVEKKSTVYKVVPPGKYIKWYMWRGEKKKGEIILDIGIGTIWHIDRDVNDVIIVDQP
jgi:hypothetical protein